MNPIFIIPGAARRHERLAKKLLLLCDGGGSNSATMYLFKEDLQKLANRLGIEIRVAHYPRTAQSTIRSSTACSPT